MKYVLLENVVITLNQTESTFNQVIFELQALFIGMENKNIMQYVTLN
jgi:hypothetical protein